MMTAYPDIVTRRLYRDDSYAQNFDARVKHIVVQGDTADIILDQTLFYAQAGGQPSDTGDFYIDGHPVAKVLAVRNASKHGETIIHSVKLLGELEVGSRIRGKVDWECRYRHMQRHSAQHILSQSFLRSHPRLATLSVNMSHAESTIDFAGQPSQAEIAKAFEIANAQGYARAAIRTLTIDDHEVAKYPLRRPPQVTGAVRLTYVGDDPHNAWEMSACGGTHVANVSEILPVHFLRSEMVKGDVTRVYFICGIEALADYRLKHDVAYGLSNDFSSQVVDVPARMSMLREELSVAKAQINQLHDHLAHSLLQQWEQSAEVITLPEIGQTRVICQRLENTHLFKTLGHLVSESHHLITCFAAPHQDKVQVLFVASPDISIDLRSIFHSVLQLLEGKGGGKGNLLQGAGKNVSKLDEALELTRVALTHLS